MTYIIKSNAPSIEACMKTVADLHDQGYAKEQITLVTNHACKETILNNWDLRGINGNIFSSHTLLEQIKHLFTIKQFYEFEKKTDAHPDDKHFLAAHVESIENGHIVILTQETGE